MTTDVRDGARDAAHRRVLRVVVQTPSVGRVAVDAGTRSPQGYCALAAGEGERTSRPPTWVGRCLLQPVGKGADAYWNPARSGSMLTCSPFLAGRSLLVLSNLKSPNNKTRFVRTTYWVATERHSTDDTHCVHQPPCTQSVESPIHPPQEDVSTAVRRGVPPYPVLAKGTRCLRDQLVVLLHATRRSGADQIPDIPC